MKLCEAMNEAGSEGAVYFLTSAYVESLQHSHCASALPAHLTTLPLEGMCDLKRRSDVLKVLLAMYYPEQHTTDSVLVEAHEVFETALRQLRALNAEERIAG